MGDVVDATADTFDELVASGLVLVDLWTESCKPCKALTPHAESIARERPELKLVKLDASKARRLVMAHGVRGLPTFLLFRDGTEVARITDPNLQPHQLDEWLGEQLDGLNAQEE